MIGDLELRPLGQALGTEVLSVDLSTQKEQFGASRQEMNG